MKQLLIRVLSGVIAAAGLASTAMAATNLLVYTALETDQLKAYKESFEKANPDITVKLESRPGGADGDNLVKTKLSTGDMADVFWYNSGSLLQALSPERNLVDLTGDAALKDTDPAFLPTVTQNGKVYGAPVGTVMGGAFNDAEVGQLLGLPEGYESLYILPVGVPA